MYIDRKEAGQSLMIRSYIGKKVPANCTALGKVMIAFLKEQELEAFLEKEELVRMTESSIVDANDLRLFVGQWLQLGAYSADIAPVPDGDKKVNMLDFAVLAQNWMIGLE